MFNSVEDKKIYEQVIFQLQKLILERKLKKGDILPPERELMEEFQVSRNSLREAISALTALGIIEKKQGIGTKISYDLTLGLYMPLALIFCLDDGDLHTVLSFRYIMEAQIIKILLAQCDDSDFALLQKIVEKTEKAVSKKELLELDMEFHTTMAQLSGNKLIIYFTNAIHSLATEQMAKTHTKISKGSTWDFGTFKRMLTENHTKILTHLLKREKDAALQALAEGFEKGYPEYSFSVEKACL